MSIMNDLHTLGINPFAVTLLAESVLKSPLAPMTVGKPQRIAFPVSRSDCAGWAGVRITIEAVREADRDAPWPPAPTTAEVEALTAERDRLAAEVESLRKSVAFEVQRQVGYEKEADRMSLHAVGLAAEVEALRADAGRYRWLRHGDNDELCISFMSDGTPFMLRSERLDARIDSEMANPPIVVAVDPNSDAAMKGKP